MDEDAADEPLTIGTLARAAGVGVQTLRFYERQGLLPRPGRGSSGYRQYPPQALERVRFIRRAKELGFTLGEIRELLDLRADKRTTWAEVRQRAEEKIDDIDAKIADLKKMREALRHLISRCRGEGFTSECPILDTFGETKRAC